jgi:hypothetical protein
VIGSVFRLYQLFSIISKYACADYQVQLVVEVIGPAFTSLRFAFCNGCPEQLAAKADASAWANGLRDGLSAALALKTGQ